MIVDGGVRLQQLHLARDDDVAEAAEEGSLPLIKRPPKIGREVGDREQRDAPLVQLLDDRVDARNGVADRLAEPVAPGGDQVCIIGELLGKFGRRLAERAPAVERVVPVPQVDILDEAQPRLIVSYLFDQKAVRIPAVEDVAAVEDDCLSGGGQPWRALKRRLVLLMT